MNKEKAIRLYLYEDLDFDSLVCNIGYEDAKAVQSSKRIYDNSDEIIGDIIKDL